jgi:uncharacterized protein DUF6455
MGDLCYSRPMLDRVLSQAELMDRMIDHVGVDPMALARLDRGMAWYEGRTRCIDCHHERQCRDWLGQHAAAATPPDFCVNAELFRACLSEAAEDEGPVAAD